MRLRDAADADGPALIELISKIYDEYGEIMHTAGADSDLLAVEASYAGRGGAFIVLELEDKVVGCHATSPIDPKTGRITFRRLYLEKSLRGQPYGKQLMDWAVEWSRDHDYKRVEFWSDTRFTRAHAFFERYGFTKTGETRDMHDGILPYSEYAFEMAL